KKEYWTDLLARVKKKPGFSVRLGVNVCRLRLATGNLTSTNIYLEMAQLALQAGVPAEANAIVDKGYEVKALGVGKEAERKQRLGEAQIYAGQKARGVQTLRTVQGNDGTADIARLWVLHARA